MGLNGNFFYLTDEKQNEKLHEKLCILFYI